MSAKADPVYNISFEGESRTLPLGWKVHLEESATLWLNGTGELEFSLQDRMSQGSAGAVYLEDDRPALLEQSPQNFRAITILHYTGLFFRRGLVARVQPSSPDLANPNGYYACLYRAGEIDYLELSRDPQGAKSTVLKRKALGSLEPGLYALILELSGEHLTAVLYDEERITEIGRVAVLDETYASGLTGIRSYMNQYSGNKKLLPLYKSFFIEEL